MSEEHTFEGARVRRGIARLMAGSAAAALAIAAYALPVWMDEGQAHAQGGSGAGTGSAAATISGAQNVLGVPGGTASVSFRVDTEEGESAAAAFEVIFDSTFVNITADDCQLDDRLEDQIRSVTFPPANQPDPPNRLVRLGVFPPIADPIPSFDDGVVFVCDFSVAGNAPLNQVIELTVQPVQVARADNSIICEGDDCDAVNGSIRIGQVTPPTATITPSVVPPTATRTPTFTPTTAIAATSTPTSTPTLDGEDTPTSTPTATTAVPATPTNTRVPTTVAPTATNTVPPQATATSTPTSGPGQQSEFDDSCAIVPVERSSPFRSLILLVGPALLLFGRRRGR